MLMSMNTTQSSHSAPLSIPTETFLLFTNDTGRQQSTQWRRYAVAAAAVIELALRERIDIAEGRDPKVSVRDASPVGDPVLDTALQAIAARDGKRLSGTTRHRSMDLTEVVGDQLVGLGALEKKSGFFGTTWPVQDPALENALRARLAAALRWTPGADGDGPSLQDVIILTILKAMRAGYVVIRDDVPELKRGEVLAKIDQLGENSPAAGTVKALRRQIDSINAAIMAGTMSAYYS